MQGTSSDNNLTSPFLKGVLPSQTLHYLAVQQHILSGAPLLPNQIQPASLDLRLGKTAYRIRASFMPGRHRRVSDLLGDYAMHQMDLTGSAVLETGCVYLCPLSETLDLPRGISGIANAKSSTGRLDVFTRLITDHGEEFDRVSDGYRGPLYAEISPRTFSILVQTGQRLNQLRLRAGESTYTGPELMALHDQYRLVSSPDALIDTNGVAFTVDLRPRAGQPAGYRAKPHAGLIDLAKINHYPITDFWEPLFPAKGERLILDPGAFYILASRESVHVPPVCAAEMTPYSALIGEFRVHYAGFFDPGFGHSAAGGSGARGVLEVRCHEVPFVLEHGQTVGRLVYEPMQAAPNQLYGTELGSNYQAQGLKLAKHFQHADT